MTVGETQTLTATITSSNATNRSVTWSSSNKNIATVSSSGVVSAKAAGSATITVTTNDGGKIATCSVTVKAKTVSVTGVSLDKTSLTLTEDDTYTLTATVSPSNATDKSVTWSSNNPSVATVSSSGVVTAKSAGTAKITVTTNDGGNTATCSVTVQAKKISVTGVSLNKTSLSMTEGDTQTLTATVTPSNATDKSVTWSSSNTSVATVSSSGVVTAKAAGSTSITVKTIDGGKTATCSVTVKAKTVSVTGVGLDKTSLSLTEGDTYTLTATVSPSNATDKSVTWSSNTTSVATVSSSGVVTAKAAGSATITVITNDGGKTARCSVTVHASTGFENGHEWIDLGLPSGLKWATCNVGASKPEEYGDYYAWGEIEPYYSNLDPLTWKEGKENGYYLPSYKWCMGADTTMTKYCTNSSYGYNGFTDNKTVLDPEDDAAYVNWGGKWRMPTYAEFTELRKNCTWERTTQNRVNGYIATGPNGNSIFLPAAGFWFITDLWNAGRTGQYQSSSLCTDAPFRSWAVGLYSDEVNGCISYREYGQSVRPVTE